MILAMGFLSPEAAISKPLKLELDQVWDRTFLRFFVLFLFSCLRNTGQRIVCYQVFNIL